MSRENVESVRQSNALLKEGDVEGAFRFLHPDNEWVVAREHPEARTVAGREAVAAYQRDWQRTLPNVHLKLDRILDVGDQRSLVAGRFKPELRMLLDGTIPQDPGAIVMAAE